MLFLQTLGGLRLSADAGRAAAMEGQTRRLTLLAILAAAGSAGIRRDTLLAMFWPDVDMQGARNSLKQAVFVLRRELASPDLIVGTSQLRLNPEVIDCDLWKFQSALEAGDYEQAAANYAGEFLRGVHTGIGNELDAWIENERTRLDLAHSEALERLARLLNQEGRHRDSIAVWRTLFLKDRTASAPAMALMTQLANGGDAPSALDVFATHQAAVFAEHDVQPDAQVTALAQTIRARLGTPSAAPSRPDAVPEAFLSSELRVPRPAVRRLPAAALATLGLVSIVWATQQGGERVSASGGFLPRLALVQFEATGEDSTFLREGLPSLIAASMAGAGQIDIVTPPARFFSRESAARVADFYLTGTAVPVASSIHVTALLHESVRPSEPLAHVTTIVHEAQLAAGIEAISKHLLSEAARRGRLQPSHGFPTDSTPLEALRHYFLGEREFRLGRYSTAAASFSDAVHADSQFALGWYRLAVAADWAGLPQSEILRAAATASRLADRLRPVERLLLRAYAGWWEGKAALAESLYAAVVSVDSFNTEAWFQLGEVRFHLGPLAGQDAASSRPMFRRVLSDSRYRLIALKHLLRLATRDRHSSDVLQLAKDIRSLSSDTLESTFLVGSLTQDVAALDAALVALSRERGDRIAHMAETVYLFASDLLLARRIVALYDRPQFSSERRAWANTVQAMLLAGAGRWKDAAEHLTQGTALDSVRGLSVSLWLAAHPYAPRGFAGIAQRTRLGSIVHTQPAVTEIWSPPALRTAYRLFALGLSSEDSTEDDWIVALASMAADTSIGAGARALGARLEARRHLRRGDPARAAHVLDAAPRPDTPWYRTEFGSIGLEAWIYSEAYSATGLTREALRWLSVAGESSIYDAPFRFPAAVRRGELLAEQGQVSNARREFSQALSLWRLADTEYAPLLDSLAARLQR